MKFKCVNCRKTFHGYFSRISVGKCCSLKCKKEARAKGLFVTPNKRHKKYTKNKIAHVRERHYSEYNLWRESVLKMNNNSCKICDNTGNTAHHILDKKQFPELRFAINNGVCLCASCHGKIHNWKWGKLLNEKLS